MIAAKDRKRDAVQAFDEACDAMEGGELRAAAEIIARSSLPMAAFEGISAAARKRFFSEQGA